MKSNMLPASALLVLSLVVGFVSIDLSTLEHHEAVGRTQVAQLVDATDRFVKKSSNACAAGQLAVVAGAGNGAAGTAFEPIIFVNASTQPCWLEGFPKLTMSNGGAPGPVSAIHRSYGVYKNVPPRPVILKPGADASVGLSYSDNPTTGSDGKLSVCRRFSRITLRWRGLDNLQWSIQISSTETPCGPRFSITPFESGALPRID
jgi:hypothetical protein